jgi:hypothetical protein
MNRLGGLVLASAVLSGCAASTVTPRALGVSAQDAFAEARTIAASWADDARLRWVEGEAINDRGFALPDRGHWTFHYTSRTTDLGLTVRVSPLELVSEERRPTSPPGFHLDDRSLGASWIDAGRALESVTPALEPPISMLLLPTRPPQWVIRSDIGRRWRVHAETGEVLSS